MMPLIIIVLILFFNNVSIYGYRQIKMLHNFHKFQNSIKDNVYSVITISMAKDDSVNRRKERRLGNKKKVIDDNEIIENSNTNKVANNLNTKSIQVRPDGSNSLEDLFGLGNDQLRELNEQFLPLPREDLVTGKEVVTDDKNKVFKLPDLNEFMTDTGGTGKSERDKIREKTENENGNENKIDRRDQDEYLRVMQLNPFADADESMFVDEYDIIQSIFGTGKLLNIPIPYLQTGHGILFFITLLGALIYAPGNPLTEFPSEIRDFFKNGLIITYSINLILAINSFFIAKSKNLPGIFWFIKVFLLGGISYYELGITKDPKSLPTYQGTLPTDRKAKR